MKKIIHHLRRQPEEVRRHILHIVTIALAVILLMLWVYSLGTNFTNSDLEIKEEEGLGPFSVLKNNIVDGYESIRDPQSDMSDMLE